jgi:sulfotransferase family protein
MTSNPTGLPDFLIIGAMKCGTTTLYFDLQAQPAICMSTIKEPSVLIRVPDPAEAAAYYRKLFEAMLEHRRFGEASTFYSQLPRHTGVAQRARHLLGPDLRVIYVVRNPVERAISHHYHEFSRGACGPDVDAVVRADSTLIDFGRYAMQLEAWRRVFGDDAALVLRFEDCVRDRGTSVQRVGDFLSVPVDVTRIQVEKAFNQSEGKLVPLVPGPFRPILDSDLYRLWIRRAIPTRLRHRLRDLLAPSTPRRPPHPRPDTIDYLVERLAPDADRLAAMLGWRSPIWDFEATRRKYAEPASAEVRAH